MAIRATVASDDLGLAVARPMKSGIEVMFCALLRRTNPHDQRASRGRSLRMGRDRSSGSRRSPVREATPTEPKEGQLVAVDRERERVDEVAPAALTAEARVRSP